jgi:phospholipid-translocating ATPase
MWVMGDLKDQLGIRHRKERKNRNVEAQPILRELHSRSLSEPVSPHESYELAASSSPPPDTITRSTYLGTPPMDQRDIPDATTSNTRREQEEPPPLVNPYDQLQAPSHQTRPLPSPQFSYYSVSDIPPPSESYQFTTVTGTHDRPNSGATSSSQVYPKQRQRLSPPPMTQSQDLSSPSLLYHDTGASEAVTVRKKSEVVSTTSPKLSVNDPDRSATGLSYRTDDYMTAEDDGDIGDGPQTGKSYVTASEEGVGRSGSTRGWRESQVRRQSQDEEDDARTIVGQRESTGWGIGRAM